MKEVEIKARLIDREKITDNLKKLCCVFEKPCTQEDVVYVKSTGSLVNYRSNDVFLRIRVKNGNKIFFAVKKRMSNDLDAIEHELEINSKEEMEQALLLLEYKEAVRISKNRVVTHYNDCEICIDDVDDLGTFVEMEKLTEEGDSRAIQEEMFKFLESIGIDSKDRVNSGYDILMLEKNESNEI
jgi:adenylate cyclase class 2